MIKNIFKGKKNLIVLEFLGESDNVYFNVHEFNIKLRQSDKKKYPHNIRKDYLKNKYLKPISYKEFEDILLNEHDKIIKNLDNLYNKFNSIANETKNPEFRHFIYEYDLGKLPLLTEGVVKVLAIVNKFIKLLTEWDEFGKLITQDDCIENKISLEVPENELFQKTIKIITSKDYVQAIVQKGKYIFDENVLDEIPEDEEQAANPETEDSEKQGE